MTRLEVREWWAERLREFAQSEKSLAAFCRERELKYQNALSWKRKLDLEERGDETEKLEFAEIRFADGDGDVILRRRGWEILIPAHFEAQTLRRLLAIFEEA